MSFRKTLLITGASSGFGQALAREALDAGHRVVGTVRSEEARSALEAVAPARPSAGCWMSPTLPPSSRRSQPSSATSVRWTCW
ncbi:short chain dehydrogenase [Pseudomonas aeruginosa]|nr:short chain dehydrogenase [Pseudomonas aeruginosa]